jgi:putative sterol carrier protein
MASTVNADIVSKVKAIFQWNIMKNGSPVGVWTVDLKNGNGSVYTGPSKEKAGCTLTIGDDDLALLAAGKLDAMKAFTGGKLKVSGNVMLAQKLQLLFKQAPRAVTAVAAASTPLQAETVFNQIKERVSTEADLVKKVGAIFQWNITKDGSVAGTWTTDLKNGNGSVYEGAAKDKPGCTLTMSDDDLVQLVTGKMDAMKAFMGGKLKIAGNIMLAQKLQVLLKDAPRLSTSAAAATPLKVVNA